MGIEWILPINGMGSSTIPMEFSTRKAISAVTGFIDGYGYIGTAITSFTSGVLIGVAGSEAAFSLWIIFALTSLLILLTDLKSLPEKREVL